jgi:hypothetical protein
VNFITNWHSGRPPASTFAEGQQALMVKLLARCGIVCTAIVWRWPLVLILAIGQPPSSISFWKSSAASSCFMG